MRFTNLLLCAYSYVIIIYHATTCSVPATLDVVPLPYPPSFPPDSLYSVVDPNRMMIHFALHHPSQPSTIHSAHINFLPFQFYIYFINHLVIVLYRRCLSAVARILLHQFRDEINSAAVVCLCCARYVE